MVNKNVKALPARQGFDVLRLHEDCLVAKSCDRSGAAGALGTLKKCEDVLRRKALSEDRMRNGEPRDSAVL